MKRRKLNAEHAEGAEKRKRFNTEDTE